MNTKQKLKLKKFINELSLIKGRHTELVSVYIPSGYDLIKVIQHLQQEQGTAANIKDAKKLNNSWYQKKIATLISNGIISALGEK